MTNDEIKRYDEIYQNFYLKHAKEMQNIIDKYKKSTLYYNYKYICSQEADLIIKLAGDLQDDRVYFSIYVYLYRNGYLSTNRYFEYNIDKEEIDCNMRGICYIRQRRL